MVRNKAPDGRKKAPCHRYFIVEIFDRRGSKKAPIRLLSFGHAHATREALRSGFKTSRSLSNGVLIKTMDEKSGRNIWYTYKKHADAKTGPGPGFIKIAAPNLDKPPKELKGGETTTKHDAYRKDQGRCALMPVIQQYAGTCWLNSLLTCLLQSFFSQRLLKIHKVKKWPIESDPDIVRRRMYQSFVNLLYWTPTKKNAPHFLKVESFLEGLKKLYPNAILRNRTCHTGGTARHLIEAFFLLCDLMKTRCEYTDQFKFGRPHLQEDFSKAELVLVDVYNINTRRLTKPFAFRNVYDDNRITWLSDYENCKEHGPLSESECAEIYNKQTKWEESSTGSSRMTNSINSIGNNKVSIKDNEIMDTSGNKFVIDSVVLANKDHIVSGVTCENGDRYIVNTKKEINNRWVRYDWLMYPIFELEDDNDIPIPVDKKTETTFDPYFWVCVNVSTTAASSFSVSSWLTEWMNPKRAPKMLHDSAESREGNNNGTMMLNTPSESSIEIDQESQRHNTLVMKLRHLIQKRNVENSESRPNLEDADLPKIRALLKSKLRILRILAENFSRFWKQRPHGVVKWYYMISEILGVADFRSATSGRDTLKNVTSRYCKIWTLVREDDMRKVCKRLYTITQKFDKTEETRTLSLVPENPKKSNRRDLSVIANKARWLVKYLRKNWKSEFDEDDDEYKYGDEVTFSNNSYSTADLEEFQKMRQKRIQNAVP